MRRKAVQFKTDPTERSRIDERAEEAGFSRAEYVRQRFRAGELLWEAGELNTELLTKLEDIDDLETLLTRETDEGTHNEVASNESDRPATTHGDLAEIVLKNIPHEKTGDAVSDKELSEIIFGTEKERENALNNVIKELFGDKIRRRHDGKLVRTGD